MSEERLNEELAALEAALGSLKPVRSKIERDRVIFLAGRALETQMQAPRRRRINAWLWPCATAASLLAAATFASLWATSGQPPVVQRTAEVPAATPGQLATGRPSSNFAGWQLHPSPPRKSVRVLPRPSATRPSGDPGRSKPGAVSRPT
jgi:hypothetical protein